MRRDPRHELAKEHGSHTLEVVRGMVLSVHGDDVFVELGPNRQGVISVREFDEAPEEGDTFSFTLRGREESLWCLALAERRSMASWEEMEVGSLVSARVLRLHDENFQLKVGALHAWMPRSQCGIPRGHDVKPLIGKTLTVEVIEIDTRHQRVIVSRKTVLQREKEQRGTRIHMVPGDRVNGRITRIEPYGAFVQLTRGRLGMIHVSNMAHERIDAPTTLFRVGETVETRVLSVRADGKRISLGMKQLTENPWNALERSAYEGQLVEGTAIRIAAFGIFVRVEPGVVGLVHDSQLPGGKAGRAGVARGDKVTVRILSIDVEAERLSLSLLHRSGRALAHDEATMVEDLDALAGELCETEHGTNLGDLLRRAMHAQSESDDVTEHRDAG